MGAPITATASLTSGFLQSKASENASEAQQQTAREAQDISKEQFQTILGQEQPFLGVGTGAANQLADLLGTSGNTGAENYGSLAKSFTPQDYLNNQDPGYQFQLQQGQNALINRTATTGSALGGAALKSLINYNQDYAKTGYNDAFNRFQTQQNNVYQRLANIANLGQNAATLTGQTGTTLAGQQANAAMAAGNAQAAGYLGSANAWANSINKTGDAFAQGADNFAKMGMMFMGGA